MDLMMMTLRGVVRALLVVCAVLLLCGIALLSRYESVWEAMLGGVAVSLSFPLFLLAQRLRKFMRSDDDVASHLVAGHNFGREAARSRHRLIEGFNAFVQGEFRTARSAFEAAAAAASRAALAADTMARYDDTNGGAGNAQPKFRG